MSALAKIVSARERWERARIGKASRVFLPADLHEAIHEQAEKSGVSAPLFPVNEEERLEVKGMKVYRHAAQSIAFE